jgi:hypothetical protein
MRHHSYNEARGLSKFVLNIEDFISVSEIKERASLRMVLGSWLCDTRFLVEQTMGSALQIP